MGCDAEVIAIGPFSQAVAHALEYSAEHYRDIPEGATVISASVFEANGSSESRQLAQRFGVGVWDLGQHVLDPLRANLTGLRADFDESSVARFLVLREAGFQFYYLPHG